MKELRAIDAPPAVREIVYDRLKNMILANGFNAGRRLVEHELAETLAVSRTPVRDALRRLESDGILRALPKGGLAVREYGDTEVEELYRIREALEGLAAEYAAANATAEDIKSLEEHLEKTRDHEEGSGADKHETTRMHREFTVMYCRSCRMPNLLHMLEPLMERMTLARSLSMTTGERRRMVAEEHRAIFEAVKAGDVLRAGEVARAHVRRAYHAYKTREERPGKE